MIYDRLKELLCAQLGVDEDMVTPDANIIDDLGADSLDVVELISAVEDEFSIIISDDRVRGLATVRDVVEFLENLV